MVKPFFEFAIERGITEWDIVKLRGLLEECAVADEASKRRLGFRFIVRAPKSVMLFLRELKPHYAKYKVGEAKKGIKRNPIMRRWEAGGFTPEELEWAKLWRKTTG